MSEQAAVWYWNYGVAEVIVDDLDEAIGDVLAMSEAGDCSPQGVQYPDGTYNDWDEDPHVARLQAERDARRKAELAEAQARPRPATRSVRAPWQPASGRQHTTKNHLAPLVPDVLISLLRDELRRQWEYNHAEHCGNEWPHTDMSPCYWPAPSLLEESQ